MAYFPNSISQIKKRFRAAVPKGVSWSNDISGRLTVYETWKSRPYDSIDKLFDCVSFEVGDFLGRVPDDIRFLLKEINRLKKELKK